MASRLATVRDAILTRIQGINGAAGGYTFTIKQSGNVAVPVDLVKSFPAAFVVVDGWEREGNRMGDGAAANRVKARYAVLAYLSGTTAQKDVADWAADLVKAVEADPKSLNLAYVEVVRCSSGIEFRGEQAAVEPWGMGKVIVSVEYTCGRGAL